MKKNIYLHIGFGKTGTTAIQSFFARNRVNLLKHGFLYPTTGVELYGHHLLCPLGANTIKENVYILYEKLAQEIKLSSARNVIISSENFIFALPSFIKEIDAEFSAYDVKVVFYIREQTELIESVFLQWQKTGDDYQGNVENFYRMHKPSFDFNEIIRPWVKFFGKQAIIARLYEKELIGKDVCGDIAAVLGLGELDSATERYKNLSLRPEFSALVNLIDSMNLEKEGRFKIVNEILRLSDLFRGVEKKEWLINSDLRNEIKNYYKKSNFEFSKKYLEPTHADYFCNKLERQ